MTIKIDPKLKPLYANLLRLNIASYLITSRFDHLCIENDLDQLWEKCEEYARSLSSVAVLIPGYTGYAKDALGPFLMEIFFNDNKIFLTIISEILNDFIEWSEEEKDLTKVKNSLIELGFPNSEVENAIGNTKSQPIDATTKEMFKFEDTAIEVDENLCFVLMPFDEEFNPIYLNIIKPIVESSEKRLNCKRADELFGSRPIIDDIWNYIKKARILIAELTGKNANVFYELGLAHAMQKNVILITQRLEDVPFDLRHYRCLVYENSIVGAANLKTTLKTTLKEELND